MFLKCCSTRMVYVWTGIVVLLLGGSLLLAFWGIPKIIKSQVHKNTELKQGTDQWDRFETLPFPIDFSIRFFDVTNPDEILYNTSKPILNETEPFNYKLSLKKLNISFDDDEEDSVTYRRQMSFEFDDSGTANETQNVTIINSILLASLQLVGTVERLALVGCLDKLFTPYGMGRMFITAPARQIIFDGIFFSFANASIGYACKVVRNRMLKIVENIRVIEHIAGEGTGNDYLKFSIFNYKTDFYSRESPDGIYTVNRGIKDLPQLGNIMRWNGASEISTWGNQRSKNNDTCNKVVGTDSTIYKPWIKENEALEIFNTDLCRTVQLVYKNSDETYKGVPAYRYETNPTTFKSSMSNPEDDCFCSKSTKTVNGTDSCFLDGAFDFKPCLGAPILVSQPHFLNADEHYLNGVDGLSPDNSKHNIYLLLEPNTGTPLVGMKRMQLNSVMRKEKLISEFTPVNMSEAVVPIFWMEESVFLPQKYVDLVNNQYFKAIKITDGIKYALIALFAALFAVCLFFLWRKEYFQRKTSS